MNSILEIPQDFIGESVHVSLKHLVQAKTPNGQIIPAFLAVTGQLESQMDSSIIVRVAEDSILGPPGLHCIPKETVASVVKLSALSIAKPRLSLS